MTTKTLQDVLNRIGFGNEPSFIDGGLYSVSDLAERSTALGMADSVGGVLGAAASSVAQGRTHELLHCFDVGFGAAALVKNIREDGNAQRKLGLSDDALTDDAVRSAFLAGLFHDIILSYDGSRLEGATPESTIEAVVTPTAAATFQGKAQYIKDAVGDDLRGALVLKASSSHLNPGVCRAAVQLLLSGSDIKLREEPQSAFGRLNPYKVLDAIWYHDGNYPIRGHAEADALVGDRLRLFKEGRVGIEVVEAGIKKLLGYTEQDPRWAERSERPDAEYLVRMVKKKAGTFLDDVAGTDTYAFVVDGLASQRRSKRTLRSPAFWAGVDMMPCVIAQLKGNAQLRASSGEAIDILQQRYDEVQQYRRGK